MRISVEAAEPETTSYEPSPGPAGTSEPGRSAWPWPACGWGGLVTPKNRWLVGTARYRRGGPCREVGLNAGGGDAFLLAGQQGQRPGIGRSWAARVEGAWPQPVIADGCHLGRIHQSLPTRYSRANMPATVAKLP